jgi:general secretion pathway protein F
VPRLLSPQVSAMLKTGFAIGDVRKVLPACRQLLHDAVSQTRGAIHYLIILLFVVTPAFLFTFILLMTFVMPRFREISSGMGAGTDAGISFLISHRSSMVLCQIGLMLMIWCVAFLYIGGPRAATWFPFLQRVHYHLSWRRKRMQRDFSTMLSILLDSGVPEPEAVRLAADCTSNRVFKHRASRVVDNLKRGVSLTEAIQSMDDSGEFRWRLTNATHTHAGFLNSLKGWHESLDAKAFQQEQAAAHFATTGLVLLNGVFVAIIVISVFHFLISIINAGVLW